MLRLLFFVVTFSAASCLFGQTKKRIELAFAGRYDKHADYTARYGDRSYTNDMKLWGVSGGVQFKYLHAVAKNFYLTAGAGYFRLGVDKIRSSTPRNSGVSSRTIDYTHPTGIDPLFHTNKYWYNNVALSAGVNFENHFSGKTTLTAGADYTYLYTFSQVYSITYNQIKYKTTNSATLGFGVNAYLGILQKFKNDRCYINPKVIIPVYQRLNGDRIFREDADVKMTKWLNGAGLSLSIGKYF